MLLNVLPIENILHHANFSETLLISNTVALICWWMPAYLSQPPEADLSSVMVFICFLLVNCSYIRSFHNVTNVN